MVDHIETPPAPLTCTLLIDFLFSESNVGGANAANLRKQNITLQEQNNALKLKNDILMDMVCILLIL